MLPSTSADYEQRSSSQGSDRLI